MVYPFLDVTAAPYNAVGDGLTDNSAAYADAIADADRQHLGVYTPAGNFWIPAGVTLTSGLEFRGRGDDLTAIYSDKADGSQSGGTLITVPSGVGGARIADILVRGTSALSGGAKSLFMDKGTVGCRIDRVRLWGGNAACAFILGDDNRFYDVSFGIVTEGGILCTSEGANWYCFCGFDNADSTPTAWGFYQGNHAAGGVAENTFIGCDFSGNYPNSVGVECTDNSALMKFTNCIFSGHVSIAGGQFVSFGAGCEFGASILNPNNVPLAITGSIALSPFSVPNAVKAANIGIT